MLPLARNARVSIFAKVNGGAATTVWLHVGRFERSSSSLRVAIVGSGPSGFYTAKYLLAHKATEEEERDGATAEVGEVTMVDRLPSPFGLVRYGVAPDHPEVKNVIDDFRSVAEDPRFRYCGNVRLGSKPTETTPTVTLTDLQATHDAVSVVTSTRPRTQGGQPCMH